MDETSLCEAQSGSLSGDSPFDVNDLFQNFVDRVPLCPFRVVILEPPCVTDVPDVIAAAIIFFVRIIHSVSGQFFCHPNCFQQRAIRKPPSPGVVNLTGSRILEEVIEHHDQVVTVYVVSNLLSLVSENRIVAASHATLHKIRQKAVQFGAGMIRPG